MHFLVDSVIVGGIYVYGSHGSLTDLSASGLSGSRHATTMTPSTHSRAVNMLGRQYGNLARKESVTTVRAYHKI